MKAQTKMIAASLVVIMLALSAVGGVTYSWFSDSEDSTINISTAKVDIELGNWYVNGVNTESSDTFSLGPIAAGQTKSFTNAAVNTSTISIVYRLEVTLTSSIDSEDISYDRNHINFGGVSLVKEKIEDNKLISAEYVSDWKTVPVNNNFNISFNFVTSQDYAQKDGDGLGASENLVIKAKVVAYQSDYTGAIDPTPISPSISGNTVTATIPESSEGFVSVTGNGITATSSPVATDALKGSELKIEESSVDSNISIEGAEPITSFNITATKGSESITSFNGGYVDVTITVNGTPTDNEGVSIYYCEDGVAKELMPIILMVANTTDIDKTDITFRTTHFSTFVMTVPEAESVSVSNSDEFKDIVQKNSKIISIILNADVSYDVAAWQNNALGSELTEKIYIDINGYKLTFNQLDSDWNNIATNNGATLILKNGSITNSGHNDGPWNRHDINFACNVVLENVYSDKAMAFKADAALTNVTINDANTSDTYAIWIQPNGQTVTIDGCIIDMFGCTDGRGIKIDNQYVDAEDEKKVTLSVKDTVFKTEEKAAITVKTTVGADITIDSIDISEVTADEEFAVWVDEDAEDSYSLVNVFGAKKLMEGSVKVKDANELINALNVTGGNLVFTENIYIDPAELSSGYGVTGINVEAGQIVNGNGYTLDVSGANGTWDSAINADGGIIENITVTGAFRGVFITKNGLKSPVILENVTSNPGAYTVHCDEGSGNGLIAKLCTLNGWTSYAATLGDVYFVDCHFGEGSGYAFCRPYAPTKFVGCDFEAGFEMDPRATVTFENCTIGGDALTTDNLATLVTYNIANATVI